MIDPEDGSSEEKTIEATPRSGQPLVPYIRGFLKRAVLLSLAFGVVHSLGLRAYTSMLSGTGAMDLLSRLAGAMYLFLYFGFVFLVPVLLIAAGLLKGAALTSDLWTQTNRSDESSDNATQRQGEGQE